MNSHNKQKGIGVKPKQHESFESLMRRFKKIVSKSGIIKELTQRRFFEKGCAKRKRKKAESINRVKQRERKGKNEKTSRR